MTKDKAQMIQQRINDGHENTYPETSVIADIEEIVENDFRVDARPGRLNLGDTLHNVELIADIARGFDVHTYVVIEDGVIYAKFF